MLILLTSALAAPTAEADSSLVKRFVRRVLSVHDLRGLRSTRLVISETASEVLANAGCFPIDGGVESALRSAGMLDIPAGDIIAIVHDILINGARLEDELGVRDVLLGSSSCEPPIAPCMALREFDDSHRLLAMHAVGLAWRGLAPGPALVLGGESCSHSTASTHFSAQVDAAVRVDDGVESWAAPTTVGAVYFVRASIEGLCVKLDTVAEWIAADTPEARRRAIQIHWAARANGDRVGVPIEECPDFCFGRRFEATCSRYGFLSEPSKARRLLDAIASTLSKSELKKVHALRTHSGGDAPQRARGNQLGWRRDVDYEFHLHYWEGGSNVEFGQVGPHQDFGLDT